MMRSLGLWRRVAAVTVVGAVGVVGCAAQVTGLPGPEPDAVQLFTPPEPAPTVAPEKVPVFVAPTPRWKAPFDDVPYSAGEMFVGIQYPSEDEPMLSVVGVDATGTTRWAVRTNPSCVGFGVTTSAGGPIAVVLGSDADNRKGKIATETTASGYDVRDGRRVWGPTPVPGPLQGPGLVFGQNTSSVVGGTAGPRVMLSGSTGHPVRDVPDGALARYEHNGVGLFSRGDTLFAVDTDTGMRLWSSAELPRPAGLDAGVARADLVESTQSSDAGIVAVRWSGTGMGGLSAQRTALHDLRTGRLVTTLDPTMAEPRTTVDADSATVVITGFDGASRAVEVATGMTRWRHPRSTGNLDMTLAERGIGYGTRNGRSVAIDLYTGKTVAEGEWSVPVAGIGAGIIVAPLPPETGSVPADRVAGSEPGFVAYRYGDAESMLPEGQEGVMFDAWSG